MFYTKGKSPEPADRPQVTATSVNTNTCINQTDGMVESVDSRVAGHGNEPRLSQMNDSKAILSQRSLELGIARIGKGIVE